MDNMTAQAKPTIAEFQKEIWNYYAANKRDMPWRQTTDPYRILVSEVMLQQTQVSRVLIKYAEFIQKFPTISALAKASVAEVLTLWQGLGYNRRALFLKKACEAVYALNPKNPQFPFTKEELIKLPGIGQSTAGELLAFAFNKPEPFIETNIRAVYLYFFFKESSSVSDIHIYELLQQSLAQKKARENPREWHYALYDYGTMLKAKLGKKKTELHKQSKHYNKQSTFKGSNREIRGAILRLLTKNQAQTERQICKALIEELPHRTPEDVSAQVQISLTALLKEGFIETGKKPADNPKSSGKLGTKNTPPAYRLSMV